MCMKEHVRPNMHVDCHPRDIALYLEDDVMDPWLLL